MGALVLFFLAAVSADVVLWYSLQKKDIAVQTLNDIIASQPPAPKTDAEKTALLDKLAQAHKEAVAQVEAEMGAKAVRSMPPVLQATPVSGSQQVPSPTDPVVQAKIQLLDSMRKTP